MVRSISLLNGGSTIVDDADYPAVCSFPWRRNSNGYIMFTYTENGKRRETYLHRLIMQPKRGEVVDHLNHNRLQQLPQQSPLLHLSGELALSSALCQQRLRL